MHGSCALIQTCLTLESSPTADANRSIELSRLVLYCVWEPGKRKWTRVFKNKPFIRFARKCEIADADLCRSVDAANRGLMDADLGSGVIKQRIERRDRENRAASAP